MNKIIYKIFPVLTLALALSLTACLTDSEYDNNQIGIKPGNNNFVEIHLTSTDTTNTITMGFDLVNRDTTIVKFIPVNLTSVATSDVTVTYKLLDATDPIMDSAVVHGSLINDPTKFVVLNAGNQVVIKAGTNTAYIGVKFNPSNVALSNIFGVKITAVSDPKYKLSNLIKGYVKFGIKNQWDGDYLCSGYRVRSGNPTEFIADNTIEVFSTLDANTVIKRGFGNYTGYRTKIQITTDPILVDGVSCFKVIATVIADDGTVVGGMWPVFTGDPASLPAPPAHPDEINYYNPVTRTFVLNCYYNASKNRLMYEVDVRQ